MLYNHIELKAISTKIYQPSTSGKLRSLHLHNTTIFDTVKTKKEYLNLKGHLLPTEKEGTVNTIIRELTLGVNKESKSHQDTIKEGKREFGVNLSIVSVVQHNKK